MGTATSNPEYEYSAPSMATIQRLHEEVREYITFFENPHAQWYSEKLPYICRKLHEWNMNFPPPGSDHVKGFELLEFLKLEQSATHLRHIILDQSAAIKKN